MIIVLKKASKGFISYAAKSYSYALELIRDLRTDVYIGIAEYEYPSDLFGNAGVVRLRGEYAKRRPFLRGASQFFVDIDVRDDGSSKCKSMGDAFESVRAALADGLPMPNQITLSGRGLHLWWFVDDELKEPEWKALNSALRAKAVDAGLPIDSAPGAGITGIARAAGSYNSKQLIDGKPVKVVPIVRRARDYGPEELMELLGGEFYDTPEWARGVLVGEKPDLLDFDFGMDIDPDPTVIMSECGIMRQFASDPMSCTYPVLFSMLTVAARTSDPEKMAHELAAHNKAKYDPDFINEKLDEVRETTHGPATCAKFHEQLPDVCEQCPFWYSKRSESQSPINIGMLINTQHENEDVAPPPPESDEDAIAASSAYAEVIKSADLAGIDALVPQLPDPDMNQTNLRISAAQVLAILRDIGYKTGTTDKKRLTNVVEGISLVKGVSYSYSQNVLFAEVKDGEDKTLAPAVRGLIMPIAKYYVPGATDASLLCLTRTSADEGFRIESFSQHVTAAFAGGSAAEVRRALARRAVTVDSRGAKALGWVYQAMVENAVVIDVEPNLGAMSRESGFLTLNNRHEVGREPSWATTAADIYEMSLRELNRSSDAPSLHRKGSFDTWRDTINRWASKYANNAQKIAVLTSAGAPLMHLLNFSTAHSGFVSLYGPGGSGKTYAAEVAASVWGRPSEYIKPGVSTQASLIQTAGHYQNLPLIIDEITLMDPKARADFPMKYANGVEGGRLVRDAATGTYSNQRQLASWRSICITTSNASFRDLLLSKSSSREKAEPIASRILELYTPASEDLAPNQIIELSQMRRDLNSHYGHAGDYLVHYVLNVMSAKQRDALGRFAEAKATLYCDAAGIKNSRFIATIMAAAIAADYILKVHGIDLRVDLNAGTAANANVESPAVLQEVKETKAVITDETSFDAMLIEFFAQIDMNKHYYDSKRPEHMNAEVSTPFVWRSRDRDFVIRGGEFRRWVRREYNSSVTMKAVEQAVPHSTIIKAVKPVRQPKTGVVAPCIVVHEAAFDTQTMAMQDDNVVNIDEARR